MKKIMWSMRRRNSSSDRSDRETRRKKIPAPSSCAQQAKMCAVPSASTLCEVKSPCCKRVATACTDPASSVGGAPKRGRGACPRARCAEPSRSIRCAMTRCRTTCSSWRWWIWSAVKALICRLTPSLMYFALRPQDIPTVRDRMNVYVDDTWAILVGTQCHRCTQATS